MARTPSAILARALKASTLADSFVQEFAMSVSSIPRSSSVQCLGAQGLHRMAYVEWGAPDNPRVVVCAHGLTRTGRDFDVLARALAPSFRVVCPDFVGRGRSDWLADKSGYALPQYLADAVTLIARLDVSQVHWVGTSMGGLVGMLLAGLAHTPVRSLVLNDIGPEIEAAAIERLAGYVTEMPVFDSVAAAEAWMRTSCAMWGDLEDTHWRHLATHSLRRDEQAWTLHYDPAIGEGFARACDGQPIRMWEAYDAVRCPTLVIRGADSDLLSRETLARTARCGPHARTAEVPGVGHAPMFMQDAQIALVRDFLADA